MATLANLRVKFGADTREFETATSRMGGGLKRLGGVIASVAGVAGIGALVKGSLDAVGAIADLQAKSGLSASFLTGMRQAAELSGQSIERVAAASVKLQKSAQMAVNGNKALAETFARLGIDAKAFAALKPDEQLAAFADAYAKVSSQTERTFILTKLLGGGAAGLAPLFAKGAAGLAAFRAEAARTNQVLSEDQVQAADAASDGIQKLTIRWRAFVTQASVRIAPSLMEALNVTDDLIANFAKLAPFLSFVKRGFQATGNLIGGYAAATLSGLPYDQASAMMADVRQESGNVFSRDQSAGAARRGDPSADQKIVEQLQRIAKGQEVQTGVLRRAGGAVAQ